jgi:hypothetical protein
MSPALIQLLEKQFYGKESIVSFITSIHTKPEEAAAVFQKVKPKLAVFITRAAQTNKMPTYCRLFRKPTTARWLWVMT